MEISCYVLLSSEHLLCIALGSVRTQTPTRGLVYPEVIYGLKTQIRSAQINLRHGY